MTNSILLSTRNLRVLIFCLVRPISGTLARDTLYEREHRLKRYSESKVPRLTALGFQRLLQLHPIGVSQAPNRQIIFGWRSARIATGTRFFSNCVERQPIGRNNQDEIDTRQIADLLLGNVLYTLRATTPASAAPLFNRD